MADAKRNCLFRTVTMVISAVKSGPGGPRGERFCQ
jgi:hypothetical protein